MLLDGIKGVAGWAYYNLSTMCLPKTINATTKFATDILNQTNDSPSSSNHNLRFALGIGSMVIMLLAHRYLSKCKTYR